MKGTVTVRYIGNDDLRRFLVQRQDGKLWTGRRWTDEVPKARLYTRLRDAQVVCTGMQRRRHRGSGKREFCCMLRVEVHGDQPFTLADLCAYLAQALHLLFDNAAAGDGPNGTFVLATELLSTLEESAVAKDV